MAWMLSKLHTNSVVDLIRVSYSWVRWFNESWYIWIRRINLSGWRRSIKKMVKKDLRRANWCWNSLWMYACHPVKFHCCKTANCFARMMVLCSHRVIHYPRCSLKSLWIDWRVCRIYVYMISWPLGRVLWGVLCSKKKEPGTWKTKWALLWPIDWDPPGCDSDLPEPCSKWFKDFG